MILQIHLTDNEIERFFDTMGYKCQTVDVPQFQSRTHNQGDIAMIPTLVVDVNGTIVKAKALMNEYAKMSILRPAHGSSVIIDQAARNIARYEAVTLMRGESLHAIPNNNY